MIDYHIHSSFSIDGTEPPHSFACAAKRCGLEEIGFAEHVDLNPRLFGYNFLDYSHYAAVLKDLQHQNSFPIRCGIEVSYQPHLETEIKNYITKTHCDFVIGSVHDVNHKLMDHTFLKQCDPRDYFEAVSSLIASSTCDIIGHLEYFKRWGGPYSSSDYKSEICTVLQQIVERTLVLEVNTAGLRHPCQELYPSLDVLRWYRKLGGTLICIGSDAHHVEDIAFHFPSVRTALQSEGFDSVATFSRRSLTLTEL